MHLTPYQIAAPIISLAAVAYAWNLVVRNKKSILEALFWTLFWGAIALLALYPSVLHFLSVLTGIENQVNAVIVTFLGILFFMVFYLVIRIEELEQRNAKVVRALALRDLDGGGLKESKETNPPERSGRSDRAGESNESKE